MNAYKYIYISISKRRSRPGEEVVADVVELVLEAPLAARRAAVSTPDHAHQSIRPIVHNLTANNARYLV